MRNIIALAFLAMSLASCVNYAQPTFGDDEREVGSRYHFRQH